MGVTAAAYAGQLAALLPRGKLWRGLLRAPVVGGVLLALGDTLARLDESINGLRREADPRSTLQLLPEWEASVGLPDGCLPGGGTTEQRRNAVVARLLSTGGSSPAYLIALGAAFGYTLTVEPLAPNQIRIRSAAATSTTYFRSGVSRAADRLQIFGNAQLECLINRVKPAHVQVTFAYGAA